MLTAIIVVVTSALSVFFLIGRAMQDYKPNDIMRIKEVECNVYTDIVIAAAITLVVFGFNTITLTVYHYLTCKFFILSILNYDRMLITDVDTD